jgi:hypothetical protein
MTQALYPHMNLKKKKGQTQTLEPRSTRAVSSLPSSMFQLQNRETKRGCVYICFPLKDVKLLQSCL